MPLINTAALGKLLNTSPAGAYLFYGEEEYLKRYWLGEFRKKLVPDPSLAAFNHVIINGGNLEALEASLESLPMLDFCGGGIRLIELRDTLFDKLPKAELSALSSMLSGLEDSAVIIYCLQEELTEGTKKKPSAALAALTGVCNAVCFERQSEAKLVSWVARHFAAMGCTASFEVCRYLIEYCTPDMFILSGEIEKLAYYTLSKGRAEINEATLREVASPSRIYGAFDFSNALSNGDKATALSVLGEMKRRKDKPEEIMGQISRIYNDFALLRALSDSGMNAAAIAASLKINEYALSIRLRASMRYTQEQLEGFVRLCSDADAAIKSESVNKYYLIESLILQL